MIKEFDVILQYTKKLMDHLVYPPKLDNVQENVTSSKIIITRFLKKYFKA